MVDPRFSRVRFGVNYVPSQRWWYAWNDFVPDEIARDLDAIAKIEADHIRIMLIWPYFQPNEKWVSVAHLARLDVLMSLAAERGLDVCATMLTGWLSGWAFRPTFDDPEKLYTSLRLREAIDLYFKSCARVLIRHANFLGFDLGNEINCCWSTPSLEEGDRWMESLLARFRELSPQGVHVNGVDHRPWFGPDTFSPTCLARQPIVAIHAWIEFTGARRRGDSLSPVCTHLPSAMAALVRAYAGNVQQPVWLQEFGASAQWMDAEKIPLFLEKSIEAALAGGICWLTWWVSHDIRTEFSFDPLEYDLGLLTTKNEAKPAGEIFRRLAREWKGTLVAVSNDTPGFPPAVRSDEIWGWIEKFIARTFES